MQQINYFTRHTHIYMGASQGRCPRKGVFWEGIVCFPPPQILGKVMFWRTLSDKVFFVFSATSGDPGEPPNDQKMAQSPKVRPGSPPFPTIFHLSPVFAGISCISPWWVEEQNHRGPKRRMPNVPKVKKLVLKTWGGKSLPPPIINPGKSDVLRTLSDKVFFVFSATSGDPGEHPNDQK